MTSGSVVCPSVPGSSVSIIALISARSASSSELAGMSSVFACGSTEVSAVISAPMFSSPARTSSSTDCAVSTSGSSCPMASNASRTSSSAVVPEGSCPISSRAFSTSSSACADGEAVTSTVSKSRIKPSGMSLSVITTLRATVFPAAPIFARSSSLRSAYFGSSARACVFSSLMLLTVISNGTWSPTCHS